MAATQELSSPGAARITLVAPDKAPIPAETTTGSSTDPSHGIFDVYVKVEKAERDKMEKGVEYEVVLSEDRHYGLGWKTKARVTVNRG
ncbi:MAG TPA: hypothetical protein VF669_23030 [Tepidisphaeraceae bacterium]